VGMEDEAEDNKEIRHALYSLVAKKLFGRLGKSVMKQIPHCIVAEIHNVYPAKNKDADVGFEEACDDDE
jgi:SRSO17 transposase